MHPVLRSLEADLLTATAKVGERDLERERERERIRSGGGHGRLGER